LDNKTLARQFDDAAGVLISAGHGVIARRARALLVDGDTEGAVAFLTDASDRTPLMALDTLKSAVTAWKDAGLSTTGLRRDAAWKAGRERGDQSADAIASMTEGADLPTLLARLADESQLAVANDGLPIEPLGTGPQAIGSIFGRTDTGGHALVSETSNLVSKPLGLDGAAKLSGEPAPLSAPPSEAPRQVVADSAQVPVSPPELMTKPPTGTAASAPIEKQAASAPVAKPAADAGAPTSVEVPDEPGSSLWIGLAIVVAAIVLLIWYTNRG
jgi:hypothetical protein